MNVNFSQNRARILINNLLSEIMDKTDLFLSDQETYESWLRTEVGFTQAELDDLKANGCLPQPPCVSQERE